MTNTYPDVGRFVTENLTGIESFILDSEIVAVDLERNKILPFQILSTRKRKDVKEGEIKI